MVFDKSNSPSQINSGGVLVFTNIQLSQTAIYKLNKL
ncbi:MAG: hypothetical protein JWQ84_1240 [Mucilaginibacter sp.]|nr:hypothetical protein [Mucilaginibacter sp.]